MLSHNQLKLLTWSTHSQWKLHVGFKRWVRLLTWWFMLLWLRFNIFIVPPPVSVSISHDARIIAGSSFNLTCIVLLSSNIDISVSITTEWGGPNGTIFNQTTPTEITSTNYTVIAEVNAARNDIYSCQASINPNPVSEFIDGSKSMTGSATITIGKWCI